MAPRKKASLERDFVSLIFGKEQLSLPDCVSVYNELERDPGPISRIFCDEELMLQLLSNFDNYALRLSRFFNLLNKNSVNCGNDRTRKKSWVGPGLADELVEHILFPLLTEDFRQFCLESPFLDLFSLVVDFCLPWNPKPFEKLARILVENRPVFGALVAGKTTSGIMKQWVGEFTNTVFDYHVIRAWTGALIYQCDSCESNHNIEEQKTRWHRLEELVPSLLKALRNYPKQTDNAPKKILKLDAKTINGLQAIGMVLPTSERGLEMAIQSLQKDEFVNVLKAVGGSFPCRPCYEALVDPSSARSHDQDDADTWGRLEFMQFTQLLGDGIGMWNILVSSQALEDMQQAQTEGM